MKKIKLFVLLFTTAVFTFTGCNSVTNAISDSSFFYKTPEDVPEDLGPYDIVQQAQAYSDKGNMKAAEFMYNVLLDRYGTDTAYRIEAEFEIGHMKLKQKKYDEAIYLFRDIIQLYDNAYEEYPRKYLVLATNDLNKAREALGYTDEEESEELSDDYYYEY